MDTGKDVEERAVNVAATLGVPEFVYRPSLAAKGSGVREIGDGLLICGGGGAVLQVKARSRLEGLSDSNEAASRWITKHVARAVRQGQGSKRTISAMLRQGKPLTAIPVRSMSLPVSARSQFTVILDDADCESWPTIVIVDHPNNPPVQLPYREDTFTITLNDWRELNRHLRSIHEVLLYVEDVLSHGPGVNVPLGYEFERFASLTDFEASSAARARGALGRRSFAAATDPQGLAVYRQLIDRTWGPNDYLPGVPIEDYRPILDYLDNVPAVAQAYVGRWLMERHKELGKLQHRVSGSTLLGDRPLVYICDYINNMESRKDWCAQLLALTTLRASEWREQGKKDKGALGIGVRFGRDESEYTYLLASKGARLPADLRKTTEWLFGVANFKTFQTHLPKPGRNESCFCGSGRKYKHCHLSER